FPTRRSSDLRFLGRSSHAHIHAGVFQKFAQRKAGNFGVIDEQCVFYRHDIPRFRLDAARLSNNRRTISTIRSKGSRKFSSLLPAFHWRTLRCPVTLQSIAHARLITASGKDFSCRSGQRGLTVGFAKLESATDLAAIGVKYLAFAMVLAFDELADIFLPVAVGQDSIAVEQAL